MRVGVYPIQSMLANGTPAVFALRAKLEQLRRSQSNVELVALTPAGIAPSLSSLFDEVYEMPSPSNALARLWFEQRQLPGLARKAGVDMLWTFGRAAPLRTTVPVALELFRQPRRRSPVPFERMRAAMGEAGAAGVALRYAWSDVEFEGERLNPSRRFDPFVDSTFRVTENLQDEAAKIQLKLPSAYVLAHLEQAQPLDWLLAAWSWVDASVGDQIPLVLAGLGSGRIKSVREEIRTLDLTDSIYVLPILEWEQLAPLYRGCEAYLQASPSCTGQEIRWALATGAPIAGFQSPLLAGITGGAAYLTPPGDTRALGAACLTLLVEPKEVAEPLRQKGLMRASGYHSQGAAVRWRQALLSVVEAK